MVEMEAILPKLTEWDILGSLGVDQKPRNILLATLTSINFGDIPYTATFQQWSPDGWSSAELLGGKMEVPSDAILNHDLVLQWDSPVFLPPTQLKVWLFDVLDLFPKDKADFRFDKDSTWIPCDRIGATLPQLNHLEVFAGGFGGWKAAASWMTLKGFFNSRTIAIECDQKLAKIYALSHSAVCVKSIEGLTFSTFQYANQDAIIVADIMDDGLLPLIAYWKPEVMSISSPCQPFSGASSTQGFLTEKGFLLIRALICAKFWRPQVLLLEQVHNFAKHPHKKTFDRILLWAGFQYCFQKMVNLADKASTSRPRWLAVAKRMHGDLSNKPFTSWIPTPDLTPEKCQCVLEWEAASVSDLLVTDHIRSIASDPSFALRKPDPSMSVRSQSELLFESRVYRPNQKIPTFMALYGRQHELDHDRLCQFGFFGHYLHDEVHGIRHWHPAEVALIHGISHFPFLPDEKHIAWLLLGNQISGLQALVPWIYYAQCKEFTSLSVDVIVDQFRADHLNRNNMAITKIDDGYFLHRASQTFDDDSVGCICLLREWLDANPSPVLMAWIPNHGLMSFSEIIRNWVTSPEVQRISPELNYHALEMEPGQDVLSPEDIPMVPPPEISGNEGQNEHEHVAPLFPETAIPATLRFHPLLKGCIQGEVVLEFWYDATIDKQIFEDIWPGYQIEEISPIQADGFSLRLKACLGEVNLTLQPNQTAAVIALVNEGIVTLLPPTHDLVHTLGSFNEAAMFDQFERITDQDLGKALAFFVGCNVAENPCVNTFAVYHVASVNRCNRNILWLPHTHELRMVFTGDCAAVSAQTGFWAKLLTTSALDFLGISLALTEIPQGYQLAWKSKTNSVMIPIRALSILLAVCAFRQLLPSFEPSESRTVTIKWLNRIIWQGKLANSISMQLLSSILGMATWPVYGASEFLFIQSGRRLQDTQLVSQFLPADPDLPIVIHAIQAPRGGGPSTTTKGGFRVQIANSIASSLLHEGYELQWVSKHVDKIIEMQGPKNLASIVSTPPGPKRMQDIENAFRACSIEMPPIKPKVSSEAGMVSKLRKKTITPSPEDYKVTPEYLLYEDGTQAEQRQVFSSDVRGYTLVTAEKAIPWLRAGEILSSDEVALVILGELPIPTQLKSTTVTLPCTDSQDRQVLLSATLIQLGEKHVKPKALDKHEITPEGTSLVAITLWKQDWEANWGEVTNNPYLFVKSHLSGEGALVSIWGKSFKRGKSNTSPNDALSVQMHALVKNTSLNSILLRSGFNRLWMTPKTTDGRPCGKWKLIWLDGPQDIDSITVAHAKLPGAHGLVRNKDKHAIRVAQSQFQAAWKVIHPHCDPPEEIDLQKIYKLESLPFGTTADMLQQWSKHLHWPMKPLRAVGPRSWIIGTAIEPPAGTLCFNASPILARQIPPRHAPRSNPIIAGPKPIASKGQALNVNQPQGVPPLKFDPWANYAGARPAPATPSNQGPTDLKFEAQDQRIEKLETSLKEMQLAQEESKQQLTDLKTEVQTRDTATRTHFDSKLQQMQQQLDQSFSQALQSQTKQFDQGMQELKAMLMQTKRKQPEKDNSDMEP